MIVSVPELKVCWNLADATIQRDALKFWREQNLLPDIADAAKRLRQICVVAYDGTRIVGTVEARLTRLEIVRARFAMMTLAVAPERRLENLPGELIQRAQRVLEQWSLEHPNERLMGVGTIVRIRDIDERARLPVWEPTNLTLVGYTVRGAQIRLAWFKHAKLS